MKAYGIGGILLLSWGVAAERDPFQPPSHHEASPVTSHAVGVVGSAHCLSLWQRDEQGRWHPAAVQQTRRSTVSARFPLHFTPLACYPFRCPPHSQTGRGEARGL